MRKKHEIVESAVLSVCEAFEIDRWQKLQAKTQLKLTTISKYVVIDLITSEIGCALCDAHMYFPVYNSRYSYNISSQHLIDAVNDVPSIKHKYEKAKKLFREFYLLKPDTFEIVNA